MKLSITIPDWNDIAAFNAKKVTSTWAALQAAEGKIYATAGKLLYKMEEVDKIDDARKLLAQAGVKAGSISNAAYACKVWRDLVVPGLLTEQVFDQLTFKECYGAVLAMGKKSVAIQTAEQVAEIIMEHPDCEAELLSLAQSGRTLAEAAAAQAEAIAKAEAAKAAAAAEAAQKAEDAKAYIKDETYKSPTSQTATAQADPVDETPDETPEETPEETPDETPTEETPTETPAEAPVIKFTPPTADSGPQPLTLSEVTQMFAALQQAAACLSADEQAIFGELVADWAMSLVSHEVAA